MHVHGGGTTTIGANVVGSLSVWEKQQVLEPATPLASRNIFFKKEMVLKHPSNVPVRLLGHIMEEHT
jgi:hypothetical protein